MCFGADAGEAVQIVSFTDELHHALCRHMNGEGGAEGGTMDGHTAEDQSVGPLLSITPAVERMLQVRG